MLFGLLGIGGLAMIIAALVRPFRQASEANRFDEARAAHEEEERIAEIERESR
jgi:hypothetical protein